MLCRGPVVLTFPHESGRTSSSVCSQHFATPQVCWRHTWLLGQTEQGRGLQTQALPWFFQSATGSLALELGQWKAACPACYLPVTPGAQDEIMSVSPRLRRKGHGKREEKEVPECVLLLAGCPSFLKEQFISSMLCVRLRGHVCGLSVPSC